MEDLRARADARLDQALREAPVSDPRPYLRAVLKQLRQRDGDAFQEAIRYFEETLTPAVAGDADPVAAWNDYARVLARLAGSGRTVAVDGAGRARPADEPTPEELLLHLPDDAAAPAVVLRCPRETTPAQHASIELLVLGRQTASLYD